MSLLHAVGSGGADGKFDVDDVFSTYLYTGNGSTQTINNGMNLSGRGGAVFIKTRSINYAPVWYATPRGTGGWTDSSSAVGMGGSNFMTSFNNNGFTVNVVDGGITNVAGHSIVSHTFLKAPRFFDVVTYTGDGASMYSRTIPHSLGVDPGFIFIVQSGGTIGKPTYFRLSNSSNCAYGMMLNTTAGATSNVTASSHLGPDFFRPTSTTNASGYEYTAFVFAHDPSPDGIIQCGSYTGNGSATGPVVSLGWEPQYLMIKNASGTGNWQIIDNMRGMPVGSADATLQANLSSTESSVDYVSPTATGFQITSTSSEVNTSAATYVYMAIRRSNKVPTSGTEVFQPVVYTGTNADSRLVNTTIAPDMVWVRERNDTTPLGMAVASRLTGNSRLQTSSTAAAINDADSFMTPTVGYGNSFSAMDGFGVGNDATCKVNIDVTANNHIALAFKRAKGFFDVITWTGDGTDGRMIPHSLGVRPTLGFTKSTSAANEWRVSYGPTTLFADQKLLTLTTAVSVGDAGGLRMHGSTADMVYTDSYPTSNSSGVNYIGLLFATLPGVSKVGDYIGNGSSQTIPCGFTTGARFVLIKRKDSTGDWYVWDTARGIVAANDPHLSLNTTAAEVTTDDSVDPEASGFIVNQNTATNINVNAGIYIYLAIA